MATERDGQRPDVKGRRRDPHARFRDLAAARLDWGLGDGDTDDFARHIATCQGCRRYAASLAADAELVKTLPATDAPGLIHLRLWARLHGPR